ncbi:response regulator [Spirosoma sp. KNUC1025]|uniref:response regulator n=1 Tax=Spirosoma sp. KNUC1025 TaxID=2894082 RepID=UPI00386D1655|nr:response regulator [Spirosoma sp. KNUC1025]
MHPIASPLIYVVDDDTDEHLLLGIVFSRQLNHVRLQCFNKGSELFAQLTHRLDGRLPDLILLDLHMPIHSGLEVLQVLKTDPVWRSIPVAVRATYAREAELNRCYELGSETILSKNNSYIQLINWVRDLLDSYQPLTRTQVI